VQRKRHAAPFSAVSSHGKYDIMSAREREQAKPAHREREHERKTSDAKGGIWKTQSGDRV